VNQSKASQNEFCAAIVAQLLSNAAGLRYGSVSVSLKLHDGRVVEVTYSKTELNKEKEPGQKTDKEDGASLPTP
jgi:hypothetical protein